MVRAPDPAAQLMQLGQSEMVRAIDDDGIGSRDVNAVLDNRGADQDVESLTIEVAHDGFQFTFPHLPVRNSHFDLWDDLLHGFGGLIDRGGPVVQNIDLPAPFQFTQAGLPDLLLVPLGDVSLDRMPMGRRGCDDREVSKAGQRHVQSAGDRGGGQGQQVGPGPQRLQLLLVAHAEALLFVNDDQPEVVEFHVILQQPVRADDDVQFPLGEISQNAGLFPGSPEAGDRFDPDRPIGKPITKSLAVLLGKQGGRGQNGNLEAVEGSDESGPHPDLGFSEADIATDDPVHG